MDKCAEKLRKDGADEDEASVDAFDTNCLMLRTYLKRNRVVLEPLLFEGGSEKENDNDTIDNDTGDNSVNGGNNYV